MTEFPSLTGVDATFEVSSRFHFLAQAGFFIGPYASLVGDVGESLGFFNASTGQLVRELLPGSLSLRAGMGVHDWPFRGFLLEFAYTYLSAGGATGSSAVLGTIVDSDLSASANNGTLPTSGRIHWLSLHLGYRYPFAPGWHMVFRLGVARPVSSHTEMDLGSAAGAALLNQRLDQEMDAVFRQVWMPVLGVAFVFRLGTPDYPSASPDPRQTRL